MRIRNAFFGALLLLCAIPSRGVVEAPQVIINPRPGEEMILAVPDVQPLKSEQAGALVSTLKTFNEVLWEDLKFSGVFTLAGRSFYPPQPILQAGGYQLRCLERASLQSEFSHCRDDRGHRQQPHRRAEDI